MINKILRNIAYGLFFALGILLSHAILLTILNTIRGKIEMDAFGESILILFLYLFTMCFVFYLAIAAIYLAVIKKNSSIGRKLMLASVLTLSYYLTIRAILADDEMLAPDVNNLYILILPTIVVIVLIDNLIRKRAIL